MRTRKLLAAAAASALALAASAVTVTLDRVQQRYPWNNYVDIDYTLSDDVDSGAIFKVSALIDGTEYKATAFRQAFGKTKGQHRVTWNAARDDVRLFTTNATFALSITIEKPAGYDTLVFDLDTGAYETKTLGEAQWATLNTDEYKTSKLALRVIPAQTYYYVATNGQQTGVLPHDVTVSSFLLGVFETTQTQYAKIMALGTSVEAALWPAFHSNATCRAMRPVENVGYETLRGKAADGYNWPADGHAVATNSWFGLLRAKSGGAIDFDLPTEAQWVCAGQAGYTTRFGYLGEVGDYDYDIATNAVCCVDNRTKTDAANVDLDGGPNIVGAYAAHGMNPYGLYDTMGNVWEWCLDWCNNPRADDAAVDPVGPLTGTARDCMGAAFAEKFVKGNASLISSTSRAAIRPDSYSAKPYGGNQYVGFRVAAPLVK